MVGRHEFHIQCTLCLFFFQAEDGIRDLTVTGVQTCALPISDPRRIPGRRLGVNRAFSCFPRSGECTLQNGSTRQTEPPGSTRVPSDGGGVQRSEERRVGKGVDLGGRRIIKKKKRKSDRRSRR